MTKKIKTKKINSKVVASAENPVAKTEKKTKEVSKKNSDKAKKKILAKVTEKQGANLVEEVISHREVKYLYPENCTSTLQRKSWRQKARSEINKLKRELYDIVDKGSAEYKNKAAELASKEKMYLKAV